MTKTFAIVLLLWVMPLFAQTASTTQGSTESDPTKKSTDGLVKAAHDAKSKRKKSTTKVITNKDVKKAKGSLVVLPAKEEKPAAKVEKPMTIADQDKLLKQRREANEHLDVAQKKFDGLQKELDTIEQSYYAENDPNYRDTVIQKRFDQTKKQLDTAREELANARDTVQKLSSAQR
jgi:hypothetical protein